MDQFKLASGFKEYLESLVDNQVMSEWAYMGTTNIAYGTPAGAWDTEGYLFRKTDNKHRFVLRSVPNETSSSYIVIESVNLHGQLYNIKLDSPKKHKQDENSSVLLESYSMTVGYGAKKMSEVKKAFEALDIKTNEICRVNNDQPNWQTLLTGLLSWGIIREKVKNNLKADLVVHDGSLVPDLSSNEQDELIPQSLNKILYGPPGTGKTYHTIEKAIRIINPDFDGFEDRVALKEEFNEYVKKGVIVFTTFHQSMNYEDFIEGIKPVIGNEENETIQYQIEDGIFKKLSRKAILEYYKFSPKEKESGQIKRLNLFNDAWSQLLNESEIAISNGKPKEITSLTNKLLDIVNVSDLGNLVLKPRVENAIEYTVSLKRAQKLFEAFPELSKVKNIDKEFREVIGGSNSTAYWCVLDFLNKWVQSHSDHLNVENINVDESIIRFENDIVKNSAGRVNNYVLIIDEINRGNVSQIFGELITLIEEDKRLGNDEALQVTLPYSKELFGVPPNLYIIGTMNTADRSVEALDTALRRRFSFEEMLPTSQELVSSKVLYRLWEKYLDVAWDDQRWKKAEKEFMELFGMKKEVSEEMYQSLGDIREEKSEWFSKVESNTVISFNGLKLNFLLETINNRIEKLLSKDHQIGHSYLMSVYSWDDLMYTFYNKIIPLLQEYFYGDYGKIGLVLGKGFVKLKEWDKENHSFADFKEYEGADFEERPVYEIVDYRKMKDVFKLKIRGDDKKEHEVEMDFGKAIKILMKQAVD